MNSRQINELEAYEVVLHQKIEEVNSEAWLLKHKKTGARVALLSNDDDNKVFNIGFRTPVSNDTGVPHIIEHTVLCGSKEFPVKDPFMELVKGSLNTFLNAMTYPDKTLYPVASYNDADFKNLMHIYMDAVFRPKIYDEPKIFEQEGWHYELETPEDSLTCNGVVYNEMKGVYSSVKEIMERLTQQSLFPDTTYGKESGGDPEFIPELTYEDYLDFHRRYYHPSNSFIYLYGDMDMAERLEWIDQNYLSHYERLEIDSHIAMQEPFETMAEVCQPYAITDSDSLTDNTMLAYNWVIGDYTDTELNLAFIVLDYALMQMPGAPLKQKIIDAGIGKDIYSQYADGIAQPFYSIVANYANEEDKQRLIELVDDTLKDIVKEGIDRQALRAGIANLEFKTKEADFGAYPKGLMFGLQMFSGWLYDDNKPFAYLETNKIFEKLKKMLDTDYFEKLVEKHLIANMHKSIVVMIPEKGLTVQKEKELAEKLAAKKASFSEEEICDIVRRTAELKAYQEEPSTKEELEKIPLLKLSDIDREPKPLIRQVSEEGNLTSLHNDLFTNGIGYIEICFCCDDVPEDYLSYMGLMKYVLGCMDTENRSYTDLNKEIDLYMGGFSVGTGIYISQKTKKIRFNAEVRAKVLYENMEKAYELITDICAHTRFSDTKRLKEILEEVKSRIHNMVMSSGDSVAMLRAMSYYSKTYYMRDRLAGYGFYRFLEDIVEHFDEKKQQIVQKLEEVIRYALGSATVVLNYAGNAESFEAVQTQTKELIDKLPKKDEQAGFVFTPENKNEAIKTSGQVQYVARAGNCSDLTNSYSGSMLVLGNIMRSEYLWNRIRVLGGAYGCSFNSNREGDIMMSSFRDPNLKRTSDVYLDAAAYIQNFEADERDMRKYIIGTISTLDQPKNASDMSTRELTHYMSETDFETLRRERQEVLDTTVGDIRALAPLVEKAMKQNHLCVVGSESSIEQESGLFHHIVTLK